MSGSHGRKAHTWRNRKLRDYIINCKQKVERKIHESKYSCKLSKSSPCGISFLPLRLYLSKTSPEWTHNGDPSTSRYSYTVFLTYQENTSSCYRDNCSTNFIAALFIIVISWKQSRCPSMDKEKNVLNLHNVILLWYLKKLKINGWH